MRVLILAIAILVPSASMGYEGTITSAGYQPPPTSVWVTWCRAGSDPQCRSYALNPAIPWDGQDGLSKFGRYAGGDSAVQGWSTVPAIGGEARGGEIGAALLELFRQAGVAREYSTRELWDFGFSNSCGGYTCGCSWYERITGKPHPITPGCAAGASGSGGLKPCPNDPPGCGRGKGNPCRVTGDSSLPTDQPVQRACWSGTGRVGRFMIGVPVTPPASGGVPSGGGGTAPGGVPGAARCIRVLIPAEGDPTVEACQ